MKQATTEQLNRIVGNVLAKQIIDSRRELNAVQRAVLVRLENALKIEQSLASFGK